MGVNQGPCSERWVLRQPLQPFGVKVHPWGQSAPLALGVKLCWKNMGSIKLVFCNPRLADFRVDPCQKVFSDLKTICKTRRRPRSWATQFFSGAPPAWNWTLGFVIFGTCWLATKLAEMVRWNSPRVGCRKMLRWNSPKVGCRTILRWNSPKVGFRKMLRWNSPKVGYIKMLRWNSLKVGVGKMLRWNSPKVGFRKMLRWNSPKVGHRKMLRWNSPNVGCRKSPILS
jgi:hypothetical protein